MGVIKVRCKFLIKNWFGCCCDVLLPLLFQRVLTGEGRGAD